MVDASRVQVAVLRDKNANSLMPFKEQRKKRKILKNEKKHHSVVDESSSEQQFRKSDSYLCCVKNLEPFGKPAVTGRF